MRSPGGWPIRATLICVLQTAAVAVVPASSPEHRAVSPVNSADSACVGTVVPRINRHVAATVRTKIEAGFRLAVQRVRQVPSCGALFAERTILPQRTYWRACIEAQLGQLDEAVRLLQKAFSEGLEFSDEFHRDINLEPLWGYPPFQELIRPKG